MFSDKIKIYFLLLLPWGPYTRFTPVFGCFLGGRLVEPCVHRSVYGRCRARFEGRCSTATSRNMFSLSRFFLVELGTAASARQSTHAPQAAPQAGETPHGLALGAVRGAPPHPDCRCPPLREISARLGLLRDVDPVAAAGFLEAALSLLCFVTGSLDASFCSVLGRKLAKAALIVAELERACSCQA